MSLIEIKVPDIGDFKEVEIIELLVKPGDTVKADQSLITVESDKASMEIPSSHAGVVKELKIKIGDKVATGSCRRCYGIACACSCTCRTCCGCSAGGSGSRSTSAGCAGSNGACRCTGSRPA